MPAALWLHETAVFESRMKRKVMLSPNLPIQGQEPLVSTTVSSIGGFGEKSLDNLHKRTPVRMEMQSIENAGSALPFATSLPARPSVGTDTSGLTPVGAGIELGSLAASIGLSRESVVELLRMFVTASLSDLSLITDGILSKDSRQVADAAHSLKGAALSFELNDIASAARHIEIAAHTGVPIDLDEVIESIRHRLLLINSAIDADACTQE